MKLIYNYFILLFLISSNFVFSQDTIMMKSLHLNEFNELEESEIDTNLNSFEIYDFAFINSYSNNYLSNIGLASKSNLFFLKRETGFLFNNSMYDNLIGTKDIKLINTKKHFTNLSFFSNLSKKNNNQVLRVFHTQNVNENFNVGLLFNMVNSNGEFQKQVSADNSVALFTSYTGKKYFCTGNFIYNKLKNENNGGIDDKYIEDDIYIKTNITAIPVALYDSKSINMNREINFYQSLKFSTNTDTLDSLSSKNFVVSHKLKYKYSRLNYYNNDSDYYFLYNIDTLVSDDSTFQNLIKNNVYLDFLIDNKDKELKAGAFYINEIEHFYYYKELNYFINNGIGFRFTSNDTDYNFIVEAKYFFTGRKTNNYILSGKYTKQIFSNNFVLNLFAQNKFISPEYFEEHFYSNNLSWNASFDNKNFTDIDANIENKTKKLVFGLHYGLYDNYIYFKDSVPNDSLAIISPFQNKNAENYIAVYLQKDFNFKHFRINNKLSYQSSSNNNVISVPAFSAFNSTAFKFVLVKNVLNGELGFDIFYYTKFKADNYMPATAMFYRQNSVEIGNYPKFDAFIKLKLKRARMFFKFEHANYGLMGTNYYAGIRQPLAPRVFRFGVSWSFYD